MGLIRCEQCGYDVSTKATHCPHCNTPIVLFHLKDSLTRKKAELQTPASTKTEDLTMDDTGKDTNPETVSEQPEKDSPNIFETIKTFKEQNNIGQEQVTDSGTNEEESIIKSEEAVQKNIEEVDHTDKFVKEKPPENEAQSRIENKISAEKADPVKTTRKIGNYKKISEDTSVIHKQSKVTEPPTRKIDHKKPKAAEISPATTIHKTSKTKASNTKIYLLIPIIIIFVAAALFILNRLGSKDIQSLNQQEKTENFNKNRQKIIDQINTQLNLNNYGNAQKIAQEYLYINDPEINRMYVKARKEFLMIELSKLKTDWDNFELPAALPSDNSKLKFYIDLKQHFREKRGIYDELRKIDPDNQTYTDKFRYFDGKYENLDKKFAELNKRRTELRARQKKIDSQFSTLDGSHINLEKYIKSKMKYPDSYTHIKSVYEDKGDYLIVATTYQGKDIYEQVVIKTVKARVSLDGKVLGVISEY